MHVGVVFRGALWAAIAFSLWGPLVPGPRQAVCRGEGQVSDDLVALYDAPRLNAAQARRIMASRNSKPEFPDGFRGWREERAALRRAGASADIIARVRSEADERAGGFVALALARSRSPEMRALANQFSNILNLSALESISADVAAEIVAGESNLMLGLGGLTAIEPALIQALGSADSEFSMLVLDGVEAVTPHDAASLAACEAGFMMTALEEVSPEVARAWAQRRGPLLLSDETTMTPDVTATLVTSDAFIGFVGAARFAPECAQALARARGMLFVCGVAGLSPAAAREIAAREDLPTCVMGLRGVAPEVAIVLAKSPCEVVDWSGLRACTTEVAEALVARGGTIDLSGLTELTPDVARVLARAPEDLTVGVPALTPEVAAILAGCSGRLDLCGVETLSVEVVDAFARRQNALSFSGLRSLEPTVAAALAKCPVNPLELDGVETLSPDAAGALANHEASMLSLNGLTTLDLPTAEALAARRAPWFVFLDGLTTLAPDVAAVLARHSGPLSLAGLKALPVEVADELAASESTIVLSGLTSLAPDAAAALGRCRGEVRLGDLQDITPDVARGLVGCGSLLIESVANKLTPDVAEILAGVNGCDLAFEFLTHLTPATARAVARGRSQDITLPAIRSLDGADAAEIAGVLATKRGRISLPNLSRVTPQALQCLVDAKNVVIPDIDTIEIVNTGGTSDDVIVSERRQPPKP